MDRLAIFFALNYFAQGMGGIVYEPLSYLLKDGLRLSAGQAAVFTAWMTFPFLIKPVFGLLSDMLPSRLGRRRAQMLLVSGLSAAAWLTLAAGKGWSYGGLLFLLVATNVGLAASDVVCDALMVERGKREAKTGFYQAVQIATLYSTLILTGVGGGWLSAHVPMRGIFALTALFPALIMASSAWIGEPETPRGARDAWRGLGELLAGRRFWLLSIFIFLWSFYPFLGTAQFYYQSDVLKLTPVFIGTLSTLGGIAGALGAVVYGKVVGRRWSAARVARAAVVLGAPLSLLYLFYNGAATVAAVTVILGFTGVIFRLSLMDLASQSCPAGAEAAAFSAYMSVFNLAAWSSNTLGGRLYDALRAAWPDSPFSALLALSLIGTACTLACWPLLTPLLGGGGGPAAGEDRP